MKKNSETPTPIPEDGSEVEGSVGPNEAINLVKSWERPDLGYYQEIGYKQDVLSEVGGFRGFRTAYVENDIKIKSDPDKFEGYFQESLTDNPQDYDLIDNLFEQRLVFACHYLAGRCNSFFGRCQSEEKRHNGFESYRVSGKDYAVRPLSTYKGTGEVEESYG